MTKRPRDPRYGAAVEEAWSILHRDYGITDEFVNERIAEDFREPDLWSTDKRVAVALGVLREDTLLDFLTHFEEVVHLPFPTDANTEPTVYRVFKRIKMIAPDERISKPTVWGDSLIHGRSTRLRSDAHDGRRKEGLDRLA